MLAIFYSRNSSNCKSRRMSYNNKNFVLWYNIVVVVATVFVLFSTNTGTHYNNNCNNGFTITAYIIPIKSISSTFPIVPTTSLLSMRKPLYYKNYNQLSSRRNIDSLTSSSRVTLYSTTKSKKDNNEITTTEMSLKRSNLDGTNVVFGLLWILIVLLAFTTNPIVPSGSMVEIQDSVLLNSIIENPSHPNNLNEIYFALFNLFAIIPIMIACLILPIEEVRSTIQTSSSSLSSDSDDTNNTMVSFLKKIQQQQQQELVQPQPFIVASAAIGYFALGIYLSLRRNIYPIIGSLASTVLSKNEIVDERFIGTAKNTKKLQILDKKEEAKRKIVQTASRRSVDGTMNSSSSIPFSWYTKNIWENSIVHYLMILFILYLPFGCNTISVGTTVGWDVLYNDFIHLLSTSRFCTVSCIDLFFLHISCVSLIPNDYLIRRTAVVTKKSMNNNTKDKSNQDQQQREIIEKYANQIAFATALVPYLGPALYIAIRPSIVITDREK